MTSQTISFTYPTFPGLDPRAIFNRSHSASDESKLIDNQILEAYGKQKVPGMLEWVSDQVIDVIQDNPDFHTSFQSIVNAVSLLSRVVDHGWFMPDVLVDSDGDVVLEWYVDLRNTLSISVPPRGNASMAYLLNGLSHWGIIDVNAEFDEPTAALFQKLDKLWSEQQDNLQAA